MTTSKSPAAPPRDWSPATVRVSVERMLAASPVAMPLTSVCAYCTPRSAWSTAAWRLAPSSWSLICRNSTRLTITTSTPATSMVIAPTRSCSEERHRCSARRASRRVATTVRRRSRRNRRRSRTAHGRRCGCGGAGSGPGTGGSGTPVAGFPGRVLTVLTGRTRSPAPSRCPTARSRGPLRSWLVPRCDAHGPVRSRCPTARSRGPLRSSLVPRRDAHRAVRSRWSRLVAHPAHGEHHLGLLRVALDLGAQSLHVHVDQPGVRRVPIAPDLLQQQLPGEHLARLAREGHQQVELE